MIISAICNSSVVHTNKLPSKNISTDEYDCCWLYGSPSHPHLPGNCKTRHVEYEMECQPANHHSAKTITCCESTLKQSFSSQTKGSHYSAHTWQLVRTEVLTVVLLKIWVFWDVTVCHWASNSWCLEEPWCLHLQGQAVQVSLKMEALQSFKTSITTHPVTQHCFTKRL
jgi:hypothetical protein